MIITDDCFVFCADFFGVSVDELTVPFGRFLYNPLLIGVIYVNQSKAWIIPFCPFKVISERPGEVSFYAYALVFRS